MTGNGRLTGCASSDHPDPAVAVGEVVGHLQNTLAGSPQFALVLLDDSIGGRLSVIAAAVHGLLGPDLLLAAAAPQVAGSDHLAPTRGSIVVWAVCGVDVIALDDVDGAGDEVWTGVASSFLDLTEIPDGSVTVTVVTGPDSPTPLFISGDGQRRRAAPARFRFPPGSATVVRGIGHRLVGPPMVVTEARDLALLRLDHVPARAVLVDQLETSDTFFDGPSVEFPPLRALVVQSRDGTDQPPINVIAVDPDEGSLELDARVNVGDRVQLIADDPTVGSWDLIEQILELQPNADRAALIGGQLSTSDDLFVPFAAASIQAAPGSDRDREPWTEIGAVLVHVIDGD